MNPIFYILSQLDYDPLPGTGKNDKLVNFGIKIFRALQRSRPSSSTQAIKISFTPQFCSFVSTLSQNLAPLFSEIHQPKSALFPSILALKTQ